VGSLLTLKWVYATPEGGAANDNQPVEILPDHSRHHIDDLYQLGRIGHVRGIHAKLHELEAEDPSNKAFATHLRTLVANFDLKRYMNVLEKMRKDA
jgi:hypothetical protein